MPDLAAVPTPEPPKLVEQLKLLRDEWGEGFDEDIAQPLAAVVLSIRDARRATEDSYNESLTEVEEDRDRLSAQLDDALDAKDLLEDLEDARRGVLGVEELYDKYLPKTPLAVA